MNTADAIEICEQWFAYVERQQQRATEIQRLAVMARSGQPEEAQRRLRQLDNSPVVYDGGRLEGAVRHLVDLARTAQT